MTKYSVYVCKIRRFLRDRDVSARSDLLTMPATNLANQELTLLSFHEAELKRADTLNKIFDLLVTEYTSFLNYGIFQFIVEIYRINDQDVLKYPEHLKTYLEEHKVSEFVAITTPRKKIGASSKKLVLKVNIALFTRMSKIIDLTEAIAAILGINRTALQLLDIGKGCIIVTFLIPTPVANLLFKKHTVLTRQQEKQIQYLGVMFLKCND